MSPSSPTPSVPTPRSPLVERLDPDTCRIEVVPVFGARLQIVLHSTHGMPVALEGAVAAVTVYGDGRVEYHPAEDGAA
ncbi:hypothetical protein [Streptomyces sp. NPDC007100]|uniref:hypothetical protein n=1 Tax=Streptomyces sp. NPDC007100 TaxID=3155602 RepID=UPI0034084AAC